jgi:hypothetical protein
MGMKRDSVQNFLRIILMTGMLFLLGTQWSLGDEEKSSKTISPVSPEVLKSQIKNVETRDLSMRQMQNPFQKPKKLHQRKRRNCSILLKKKKRFYLKKS